MDPVTTGGKKRSTRAKKGATRNPKAEATMMEPITDWMPPPVASTDSIVAIPVKETPCTSGSWEPIRGSPHACRNVANPPTNRAAATSRAVVAASYPAALATTSGTAIRPPYMVRMCCTAYATVRPAPSRSSSGRDPRSWERAGDALLGMRILDRGSREGTRKV